jgi:transcriptional regulator with XRE-family HTH domain
MTVADDSFGTRMAEARRTAGLSQEELAVRAGLSVRAIRNLETGRTARPRARSAHLLSEVLGAPLDILDDSGVPEGDGPAELPAVEHRLVGRDESLSAVTSLLTRADGSRLAVLSGPAGSGRTAMACAAVGLLSDQFPDGQVYVDLARMADCPPGAAQIGSRVLRSLAPGARPPNPEEDLSRLRTTLSHRKAIVVIDNAVAETQIRPLLAAAPRSSILVTARRRLPAFGPESAVELGPLHAEAAELLLASLIGADRARSQPVGLRGVARRCGHLPLALTVAGLWLAARPRRRLAKMAYELMDEAGRWDRLQVGDLSMRASVAASLAQLPLAESRLLTVLSERSGTFGQRDAAQLLEVPELVVAELIDRLEQDYLVTALKGADDRVAQYALSDFIRGHPDVLSPRISSGAGEMPGQLPGRGRGFAGVLVRDGSGRRADSWPSQDGGDQHARQRRQVM